MIAWIERVERSKYIRWIVAAASIVMIWATLGDGTAGQTTKGLLLAVAIIGSAFAGVIVGKFLGRIVAKHTLKQSDDITEGVTAAFSVFGFLFLPAVSASWANSQFGTTVDMLSIGAHFFWACAAGAVAYCVPPATKL
ncbi:hypothetical protein [Frigidibacter sp.]|uniref:hypothetical protein n=1 Tax=Frigidibacter sp. TaxID=2586418 RepID=UPI0027326461|nr:hypothetical protein [Frigidibacter sp.]